MVRGSPLRVVLLDTCVLINVLASGEAEGILAAAGGEFLICTAVRDETIYLRSEEPEPSLDRVDISSHIECGLFGLTDLRGEDEQSLYVDYASQLDDGEAMSLAIAYVRDYHIATDDRKARRLFLEGGGADERLISTAELVRRWSERHEIQAAQLSRAVEHIALRARFYPGASDPHYPWWSKIWKPS